MQVASFLFDKKNDYSALFMSNALILIVCYFSVLIGLEFTYLSSNITLFNLSTGVAVGLLIVYGLSNWLGVFMGIFLGQYFNYEPFPSSILIALGITLEAVLIQYFLIRYSRIQLNLEFIQDILKLLLVSSLVVTFFGTTYLTASLFFVDAINFDLIGIAWLCSWLGKIAGITVVTPFILVWTQDFNFEKSWFKLVELVCMMMIIVLCGGIVFGWLGDFTNDEIRYPLAYLFFPILAWSAFRFGQRTATLSTIIISTFALWGLTHNIGPFLRESVFENHFFTWLYINVASILAMILAADITQCKKIRVALHQSDERFELATTGSQDGLWDWMDTNADEMWWSKNFYELLGYSQNEIEPSIEQLLDLMHEKDRSLHYEMLDKHLQESKPYNIEYRLQTKDDGYRWFHVKAEAVNVKGSKAKRIAGSIIDVHDRKMAEQKICDLNQDLERRVSKRTNDLADINESLRREIMERNKAELEIVKLQNDLIRMGRVTTLGEMTTAVAHELHQPLMAIVNYSQSALIDLNKDIKANESTINDIKTISDQALRGGEIIRKMKNLVLLDQGHTERFDINELLIELKPLIDLEMAQNHITLKLTLWKKELITEINHVRMQQAINNLIRNSIESMKYNVNDKQLTIRTLMVNENKLKIEITDNGSGISEEDKNQIFNSFYTTKVNGLGLGLSVSKRIINQHEGELKLIDHGDGVTASIILPLTKFANG